MYSSRTLLVLMVSFLYLVPPLASGQDSTPVFDGQVAMDWLVRQCEIGPRTPGSEGNKQLRQIILDTAAEHGLSAHELCFSIENPMGEGMVEICNVVVSAGSSGGERLWLGAHFDSRPVSDKDADPDKRDQPLVGANDGASGVAVLLHLLELMGQTAPPRGVDLLFFDGEDSGHSGQVDQFCLGSRHLAKTWQDFGHPLSLGTPEALIVLDMVGDSDLSIPQEQYSLYYSPELMGEIFARAFDLGLTAFEPVPGPAVYDDHVPFLEAGIPAVDLIDFDYPLWHTAGDVPEACSAASLDQVGRLMVDLIYHP